MPIDGGQKCLEKTRCGGISFSKTFKVTGVQALKGNLEEPFLGVPPVVNNFIAKQAFIKRFREYKDGVRILLEDFGAKTIRST